MPTHSTTVSAVWKGSFAGRGHIMAPGFSQTVTLPKDFQGLGEGATPEDLLLGALASCYLITLGIMLDKASLQYSSLAVTAELRTEVQPMPTIREAILRVKVVSDESPVRLLEFSVKAESFCLIARAVAGNINKKVEFTVEPATQALPMVEA